MFLLCALRVGVLLEIKKTKGFQKNLVCSDNIILSETFHNEWQTSPIAKEIKESKLQLPT